jgi:hypothetical protein
MLLWSPLVLDIGRDYGRELTPSQCLGKKKPRMPSPQGAQSAVGAIQTQKPPTDFSGGGCCGSWLPILSKQDFSRNQHVKEGNALV